MLTPAERQAAIGKIRELPALVEEAVRDLDDGQLDTPYGEGKWTVRQVVHHLADSHMNGFIRMKLTLTEDHPTLKPYDQDSWGACVDADRAPLEDSLLILRGLQARWAALLASLPEDVWGRTAYHPENGEMTLNDLLAFFARHGEHHVAQITGLRRARGW